MINVFISSLQKLPRYVVRLYQICFFQNGFEEIACAECLTWSPDNTETFVYPGVNWSIHPCVAHVLT